jgi:molecular chaperone GrpE
MTENQTDKVKTDKGDAQPSEASAEELQAELEKAKAEAAEYLDQWRRSVAEMSNFRKRMQREQAEFNINATARVMERLLPVLDDVDRAIAALPSGQVEDDWANGFRLIQQKLYTLLDQEGVSPIPAAGQMFDPALHEAISYEVQPGHDEGQIIAEVARGYKLGDRVLKPSMVRVAKQPSAG